MAPTRKSAISLRKVLRELNKKDWYEPLATLIDHFAGVPDQDIKAGDEILNMLWQLHVMKTTDKDLPLCQFVAIRLSRLPIWHARAWNDHDAQHQYWNPLGEPFSTFKQTQTQIASAPTAYPADDIIKRWALQNLR